MKTAFHAGVAIAALAAAVPAAATLTDIFPNDFYALPAGHSTATTYLYGRRQEGTYVKGHKIGDVRADAAIAAVRFSHYLSLGGWKVAPLLVLSALDIDLSGRSVPAVLDRQRSGAGDFRVGGAVWLIDDPANNHFLAFNLMTIWPTGRYAGNELANAGEHRRRQSLTLGWIRGLGERFTLELNPELAWYGANRDSFPGNVKLQQAPTRSLTGYLRYQISPQWQGYVGLQASAGGATRLNGAEQHNAVHGRRAYVGANYAVDAGNYLNLRLGADTALDHGMKVEREIALRWVHAF